MRDQPLQQGHRLALLLLLSTDSQTRLDIEAASNPVSVLINELQDLDTSGTISFSSLTASNLIETVGGVTRVLRTVSSLRSALGLSGYSGSDGCPSDTEGQTVFSTLGANI